MNRHARRGRVVERERRRLDELISSVDVERFGRCAIRNLDHREFGIAPWLVFERYVSDAGPRRNVVDDDLRVVGGFGIKHGSDIINDFIADVECRSYRDFWRDAFGAACAVAGLVLNKPTVHRGQNVERRATAGAGFVRSIAVRCRCAGFNGLPFAVITDLEQVARAANSIVIA